MCGITGAVAFGDTNIRTECIKKMSDVLAHRGPDDAGYLCANIDKNPAEILLTDTEFQHKHPDLLCVDEGKGRHDLHSEKYNLFFGHRRLAIIDVSTQGHQPMADHSNTAWLTYNGEIYNYKEIRQELTELGYYFNSDTDSEVILAAYREWGSNCVRRFNGMFAFALWDKLTNQLFLARDRYGIKPLYYTITESKKLLFASEVKSILEYSDYSMKLDQEALLEYFTFQNIFTDKTFYQNVNLLAPGHFMMVSLNESYPELNKHQYWDFSFEERSAQASPEEYQEELQRLLKQAVQRQLVSDVEVGSYLSGGMDSGSISAFASEKISNLKTFTVGFDLHGVSDLERGFDEREQSEYLSYLFKTEHYEMVLKSGDMERCLPKFAWHLEEPRVGQSYPNFYAAKLASKFVKVVLAGTGGDELFAGYPWRYYRAVNNSSFEDYIDKYYVFWQRLVSNKTLKQLFDPIWENVSHVWTRDIFRDVFKGHNDFLRTPEDYVNHSLYFEAKTFLHGLLVVEDKLSMAHSLETRIPFLDNDLVDFSLNVPVNLKLGNLKEVVKINENDLSEKGQRYFQKTSDGKLVLRKALENILPKEVIYGVKKGFSSPDSSWFRSRTPDVTKSLNDPAALFTHYINRGVATAKINEHLDGDSNNRLFIWSMLNLEHWLRCYNS